MEEPSTPTALLKKVHSHNDLLQNVNINVVEGGGSEQSSTGGGGPGLRQRSKSLHKRSISIGEVKNMYEYFGWVYHVSVNSIGQELCHLRFLLIRSRYIALYKRDPHENPGIQPIRKGVIGPTLVMEELGLRKVNDWDVYVLRFYNCLDETKKGEIGCATAEEAQEWMEAFDNAKQQAEYELSNGGIARDKLNVETEINLDRHRPRVRRYAHGLRKLIKIGQGLETLVRQSSNVSASFKYDGQAEGSGEGGDTIEPHDWKCVRTINGVRILEDVSSQKGVLVKSVSVIDAAADTVFDVLWNIDRHQRYQWDMLTADLERVDSYDGHYDIMYGVYDPKFLTRWNSKQDFVFSRQWFRGQDGTYTILQFPASHKKKPQRSGYHRTKINASAWEIKNMNLPMGSSAPRCLVSHTLEINTDGWTKWKNNQSSKFEKSIPYVLLSQVSGLKEYLGENSVLNPESVTSALQLKSASTSMYDDSDVEDEFYDAIAADPLSSSSSDEENNDGGGEFDRKESKVKMKNAAWKMASSPLKTTSAPDANKELDLDVAPVELDLVRFQGSMHRAEDENDTNCWTSPSGAGFMIRGKNYLKDNSKVTGGVPLLKLVAVDWYKVDRAVDGVALNPKCLVQSEAGRKLPFILVFNIQVPAKPNYILVLYYVADRPINKDSLLSKFVDGTDAFRDSRLKLIPSIVEGYWMVKRAVGTKASLLGKALTCKYLRQDNFLERHIKLAFAACLTSLSCLFVMPYKFPLYHWCESPTFDMQRGNQSSIDVDVGSSSVAKSVIGIVMGYVTSIVVDLAILIEAKEETDLPEYILGTVRLNRVRLDSAVPLND